MSDLPQAFLDSLHDAPGFDRASFEAVHSEADRVNAIRGNPRKRPEARTDHPLGRLKLAAPVPWCEQGYYLRERPVFSRDPLWHAGAYYVQDASSMSLDFALRCLVPAGPLRMLDLCAAPGGKTTLLAAAMAPGSFVVANEVIASRTPVLEENVVKWGAPGIIVTRSDPRDFGGLEGFFDVIMIDAPCSGSGLFRKDPGARKEWSESLVELCHSRQQRICADVMGALKPGGLLVYSTCSYSIQEDEQIADFLMENFLLDPLPLPFDARWGIVESRSPGGKALGYRFYPDRLAGEGFYLAAFRKPGEVPQRRPRPENKRSGRGSDSGFQPLDRARRGILAPWVEDLEDQFQPVDWRGEVILATPEMASVLDMLASRLRIVSPGRRAGKFVRDQFIPDHGLAMSAVVHPGVPRIAVSKQDAIRYLMKASIELPDDPRGWVLVTYEGVGLGWVKGVGGRVNNYYPTPWRIR